MMNIYMMENPDIAAISEHVQCCEKKNRNKCRACY